MFKEHDFVVWGDICVCGQECSILQNKFHPWTENDFIAKIKCPVCGRELVVDSEKALEFYCRKILNYFNDVEGDVIDLGCGGGFLTEYMAKNEKVNKIYSIDMDMECRESVESIEYGREKISFICMDASNIGEYFTNIKVDYIVSRDVFMFIENTDKYFDDITRVVSKGMKQMGWYVSNSERMKNRMLPDKIAEELVKRNWKVKLEYLDWYKCGYFIEACK